MKISLNSRKTQLLIKSLILIALIIVTIRLYIELNLFLAALCLILLLITFRFIDFSSKYIKNAELPIVLDEMIKLINAAESELNVFTGKINPEIYCHNDVYHAILDAKKRGVSITIITDFEKALEKAQEKNDFRIIQLAKNNRIQIYDIGNKASEYNHFMVIDSLHYRMENNIHNDDKDERRPASIQYRNIWAKSLNKKFKRMIEYNMVTKAIYDDKLLVV